MSWVDCHNPTRSGDVFSEAQARRCGRLARWEAELNQRERRLRGVQEGSPGVGCSPNFVDQPDSDSWLRGHSRNEASEVPAGELLRLVQQIHGRVSANAKASEEKRLSILEAREAAVAEREKVLAARDTALESRAQGLDGRDQRLQEREAALSSRECAVDERSAALNKREQNLDERSSALDRRESDLDRRSQSTSQQHRMPPLDLSGMLPKEGVPSLMGPSSPRVFRSPERQASPKYREGNTGENPFKVESRVEEISDSEETAGSPACGIRTAEGVVGATRFQELMRMAMMDMEDEQSDGAEEEEEEEEEEEWEDGDEPHARARRPSRHERSWRRRFSAAGCAESEYEEHSEFGLSEEEFVQFYAEYGEEGMTPEEAILQWIATQGVDPETVLRAMGIQRTG